MVHSSDRFLVNHLFLILKPVSHFVVDWNWIFDLFVVVVQSLSHVQLFATPWTAAFQASLSFTISQNLLKLMSTESVMPSNYLILCFPLLLPSSFPRMRIFSNELALCIRWPKYWRFGFSISYSNNTQGWFPLELTGLISLLSKGLSRVFSNSSKHSSKASVLQCSAFFMVQISHPYLTTGKNSFDYTDLCWQSDVSAF